MLVGHPARLRLVVEKAGSSQLMPPPAVAEMPAPRHSHCSPDPPDPNGRRPMDLTIWLPGMFLLGLLAVGLMFLFVEACDKV
jgi:hypothetical protein